jgi:hypothetical protein
VIPDVPRAADGLTAGRHPPRPGDALAAKLFEAQSTLDVAVQEVLIAAALQGEAAAAAAAAAAGMRGMDVGGSNAAGRSAHCSPRGGGAWMRRGAFSNSTMVG